MNSKPLVSIIIPVYNVEKYLDKCIASVVNQTYTNLEIILIDDGSPDNCPALCDQWQSRDPRIKVIHQQNGGLSHARNEGLKLASGEFIGFVDSDDWIEPDMYELLLSALLVTDADIAVCNYQFAPKQSLLEQKKKNSRQKQYSAEEALRQVFTGKDIFIYVWNKLYRKQYLTNITFPEGKIYEDNLWTVQAVGNAKTIVSIDDSLYHYLYRNESLSHDDKQLDRRIRDKIEMLERRIEYIRKFYPCLEELVILTLQNFCWTEYLEICLNHTHLDTEGKIRRKLHRHFIQFPPIIIWDILNIKKNISRILFWTHPELLEKIYSLKKAIRINIR